MRATHDEWIATKAACSSGDTSILRQLASANQSPWAAGFVYPDLGQLICSQAPCPHLVQMCAQAGNSSGADPDCQLDEEPKQASCQLHAPPDAAPLAALPIVPLRPPLLVVSGGKRHAWLLSVQAAAHHNYPLRVVELHSFEDVVSPVQAWRSVPQAPPPAAGPPGQGPRPLGWLLVLVAGLEVL